MIRNYLFGHSPLSEPEHKATAYWLNRFLLLLAAVIMLMGFVIPLIVNPALLQFDFLLTNLLSLVVIAGALLMVHYGYVKLAATLAVFFLFAAVTYANIDIFGNARSPNLLAYFVLVPLAGLVLGKRAMLHFSILCMVAIGLIFSLELTGFLTIHPKLQSTWDDLLVWFLALTFNTILLTATIRRSEESAETARQALTTLVTVNQELQASQAKLQQAFEKEKELSELKSRFVSMASHEFRTPLTTILALSEILRSYRHKLTEQQIDQRLHKIQDQVEHLKDIMEDVLQLAKLQARRMEFNPTWTDLDALCRSILDEFQSHPNVMHRLLYTCDEMLPAAYVDKRLIRQMFNNLLSNAIKYSPIEKQVVIQLNYTCNAIVLTICDEGIGIPAADQKYLFEPFHRAANVGAIAGTGLGLVITKESVDLHGGTITVESEVDRGTTFTVRLPVPTEAPKEYAENSDH